MSSSVKVFTEKDRRHSPFIPCRHRRRRRYSPSRQRPRAATWVPEPEQSERCAPAISSGRQRLAATYLERRNRSDHRARRCWSPGGRHARKRFAICRFRSWRKNARPRFPERAAQMPPAIPLGQFPTLVETFCSPVCHIPSMGMLKSPTMPPGSNAKIIAALAPPEALYVGE